MENKQKLFSVTALFGKTPFHSNDLILLIQLLQKTETFAVRALFSKLILAI